MSQISFHVFSSKSPSHSFLQDQIFSISMWVQWKMEARKPERTNCDIRWCFDLFTIDYLTSLWKKIIRANTVDRWRSWALEVVLSPSRESINTH